MKAQELRIGNYVTIKNDIWFDYANIPMRVIKIDSETDDMFPDSTGSVGLSLAIKREDFAQMDEFIEPIQLTHEYLIISGFKKEGMGYFKAIGDIQHGYFGIEKWSDGRFFYTGYLHLELKYIHQLQNLIYVLTGEEFDAEPTRTTQNI